jgi:hypothetical protein
MAAAAFWFVQKIRRRQGFHEEDYMHTLIVPRRSMRPFDSARHELFAETTG